MHIKIQLRRVLNICNVIRFFFSSFDDTLMLIKLRNSIVIFSIKSYKYILKCYSDVDGGS